MGINIRVIARLDIKGPNLVKGIHLEGLRVLGKPEQFARYYYEAGVDEMMYVDVVASLYNRNSIHNIVTRTAREIFIPLTVAGGIRTIDDIREILRAGADKVSLNTAAIKNPEIIREASRKFGSSTVVVTIEAIQQMDGRYFAYTDNGREHTGIEVLGWAKRVEELGAGEIVITSVDREGTGLGFDIELTKMVSDAVSIPVIAHGGAGCLEDIKAVINEGNADAVAVASMLHYKFINRNGSTGDYKKEGNIEFLKSGRSFSKIASTTPPEIKQYLHSQNIPCRFNRMTDQSDD
jgi:cyclase